MPNDRTPIPSGVFYDYQPDDPDFYDANTGERMNGAFFEQWYPRRLEFPASRAIAKALPTPAALPVATGTEAAVIADITRRQAHGLAKYGVSVADNPLTLRQWLQHAYEETLDNAVYLRRAMDELDAQAAQKRAEMLG